MRARNGFTLIELMVVVLIMGILTAIATPQWISARERSRQRACIQNLREIEQAKDTYAMAAHIAEGATVNSSDIVPTYIRGTFPTCPNGGTYTIGVVGTSATCSIGGSYPHVIGQ